MDRLDKTPKGDFFKIVSKNSHKCLDIKRASTDDGANVQQYSCNGNDNQLFILQAQNNAYKIVAKHSGKCLDVKRGSTDDGANVQQYSCHGNDNQLWFLQK